RDAEAARGVIVVLLVAAALVVAGADATRRVVVAVVVIAVAGADPAGRVVAPIVPGPDPARRIVVAVAAVALDRHDVRDRVADGEAHHAIRTAAGVRGAIEERLPEPEELRVVHRALRHRAVQVPVDVDHVRAPVGERPYEREVVRAGVARGHGELD